MAKRVRHMVHATVGAVENDRTPMAAQKKNHGYFLKSVFTNCGEIIMYPKVNNSENATKQTKEAFASKGAFTFININVIHREKENSVTYMISIKRNALKYVINLVIPTFFMMFMDIFGMSIQSYETRFNFKIIIVLGFSVLLLILNDMLPNSDSPPILGIFCCACMALMIFSIAGCVLASYVMELSSKQYKIPKWIKTYLLNNLAYVLRVKVKDVTDLEMAISKNKYFYRIHLQPDVIKKKSHPKIKVNLQVKLLKKILAEIVKFHEEWKKSINKEVTESEWYTVAVVIDRLVLIIYLLFVLIVFIILIVSWAK
ncbi:5-hydroxytryptamine receptor 3A-like [Pelobates fuscus]|uniref:5-hydroxytryptamine receptor 3A-like n=1 Tax=Pelobates fuscus TaxID=191477 RepID=UPI002FE439C5